MKITEILQAYHAMPACDRLDLLCRMLRHCIPYEVHFLGTILLDEARSHFKSYISKMEANANRVSYYSSLLDGGGLTHEVCEKLCCALAVLHAGNHPVAEVIFNMLNDSRVMTRFEETNDLRVLQDFRLLYVMAVNHPAFLFNQRQHLMYTYLQRMDSVFLEKCKYSFSGSFSGSMEKTLSCELESGKYPPEGHFKDISPDAYIVRCDAHSVYKRTTDKRYVYMIQVEWSDGISYSVRRTYGDFFSFQTKLLDLFPEEGGQKSKKHPRLIPYLPGKNYSKFLKNRDVAEKRLPELHRYSRELISLPERVSRCPHVLEFFKPKPTDMKEDYPAFHKITTLYDLVESGKVRSRGPNDPLKSSPAHSPALNRSSALQRAVQNDESTPNDPTSSARSSHTLPPTSTAAAQQVNHEATPIIPRRPTYPLTRQLQKSETSAFTPVGKSILSEEELTSTATLTASVISIPGSAASHQTTPTLSQTTPTLSSDMCTADRFVYSSSKSMGPDCIPVSGPLVASKEASEGLPNDSLNVLDHQFGEIEDHPGVNGSGGVSVATSMVPSSSAAQQAMAIWRNVQMEIASTTQMGVSGGVVTRASVSPIQHVTSPASVSPLLTSTFSPPLPLASPSPTHSGASTPRSVATYPQQILYPQYNPVYFISTSPLPSPLASPKTSSKWRGSYSSVNQTQVECDSLFKWLKSLRLHKYHNKFENLTYEEFSQMTVEEFEGRGMTTGAAKKLYKKLDELKVCNFSGFRDMPFSGGMTRRLSTCSLPAALLMEQNLTPSSSCDRFSPTGSTCSLDKYSHTPSSGVERTLTSAYHRSAQEVRTAIRHSSNSEPPTTLAMLVNGGAKMIDPAVQRATHSPASAKSNSSRGVEPHSTPRTNHSTNSSAATPPSSAQSNGAGSQSNHRHRGATDHGSPSLQNSSWADTPEEDVSVSRPEWAHLANESNSRGVGNRNKVQSHAGSGIRPQGGSTPDAVAHHHGTFRSSVSTSHPVHGHQAHYPNTKNNPHEGGATSHVPNASDIIVPQPLHPGTGRAQVGVANPNWNKLVRPYLHPSNMTIMQSPTQHPPRVGHHHLVHHNQNNSSANGLMRGPILPQGRAHGILMFPPGGMTPAYSSSHPAAAGHAHPSPPVACYNCGKRGHLGNTCPGVTMDATDTSSFHKQLEKLLTGKESAS